MSTAAHLKALAEETVRAFAADPSLAAGGGKTRVRLTDGLTCEIEDGSWRFIADVPASAGGADRGPDPGVLIRAALGSCLSIDIVTWAARFDVDVTSVEVEVESVMDARGNYGVDETVPAGYQAVICRVQIESPAPEETVRRIVEVAEAHNPRLYDMTHAIPVTRELSITRPRSRRTAEGALDVIEGGRGQVTGESNSAGKKVASGRMSETADSVIIRPARLEDCGDIAKLFLMSSDGLAEYIWSQFAADGDSLLEVGRARYARQGTAFSYQNCLVAEEDGKVIAMLHSFPMPPRDEAVANDNATGGIEEPDPVLQPYAELEDAGSLYVSGVAVYPQHRGRGLGRRLMEQARARAEALGLPRVSLICFEANDTALQLYRRLGYVEADRRPIIPHPSLHYAEGDALLLVRGLD